MGKIVDVGKHQRRKLHLMSLESGEKVLTSWIDNETAQKFLKVENAVIYRLPSGQFFADITAMDKLILDAGKLAEDNEEISNEQASVSHKPIPQPRSAAGKTDIDISDLL